MRFLNWLSGFTLIIFTVSCSQNTAPEIDIPAQIEQFAAETKKISTKTYTDDDFKNYTDGFKDAFQHNFPKKMRLHILKTADKEQLTRLTADIHNYLLTTNDPAALAFVENLYEKLEDNDWLDARDPASMYRLYFSVRSFEKAEVFKKTHPNVDLPTGLKVENWASYSRTPDNGKRFVFDTVQGEKYLTVNQIAFSNYTGVVATVAPGCHFFINFLKSAGADTEFATAFLDNTLWLTSDYLTTNHVIDWNKSMPKVQMHYAVYAADWPEINNWASPNFYFFKDGEVIRKVVGWPRDAVEQRTIALKDGFRAIGVEIQASSE